MRRASRRPPVRSDRGSPTPSAWRLRSGISRREFGADVVDHRTYVIASDGDLMEGISQEAIALAGHLKLARLIVLFDDNGISIDGPLSLADSVDQVKRFEACGWNACRVDGHDPDAIAAAIAAAQTVRSPEPDRLPHRHRLRRAHQGRQREVARLAARPGRGEGRARKTRLDVAAVRGAGGHRRGVARGRIALAHRAALLGAAAREPRAGQARRIRSPARRRPADRGARRRGARHEREARRRTEGDRDPRRLGKRARSARCRRAGDGRRLRRPHRLQQHAAEGHGGTDGGEPRRPLHPLRRARARHGRGDERDGAAWRDHSLFRHLPGVLRLCAAGAPARRADGRCG